MHEISENGNEFLFKYDKKGNLIYCKDSKGTKIWYKYDDNGNLIHCKYSNGFEKIME